MNVSTAQIDDWVHRLKAGTLDLSDLAPLEQVNFDRVVEELRSQFVHLFLERQLRDKREIGLAQSRYRRAGTTIFRECVMLTSEAGLLTGLAVTPFLRIRTNRRARGEFELVSGAGFNLYRDMDGWKLKLLHERTISLANDSLHRRGWNVSTGH